MIDIESNKRHIFDVVGALHEVHKELGAGLNEYLSFHPTYHGREMSAVYRVDFLCKDDIIVECKAVAELTSNHRAQLFNYMRLLGCVCGILVNFTPKFATIERYFLDKETNEIVGTDGKVKQFL